MSGREAPRMRGFTPGAERARRLAVDAAAGEALAFAEEPLRISAEDFRAMAVSCAESGASDITIQTGQQPRVELDGVLHRLTRRPWAPSEVETVLAEIYGGANAIAEIGGQRVLDFSYELRLPGGSRQRFRCNAVGVLGRDRHGVEITMRALPRATPDAAALGLLEGEIAAMRPRDGMVVFAGATGSGKSTLLAAILRRHLEDRSRPVKIVDIQAPIEHTFRDVTGAMRGAPSLIGISEVGRHIRGFSEGVHAALRRRPDIISIGEARDAETVSAAIEAALTGHLVYTTTHAGSAAGAIHRLVSAFPAAEREQRAHDLAAALRFLMVQHLAARADGAGRVPVRERLCVTEGLRGRLVRAPAAQWPALVADEIAGRDAAPGAGDMRRSLAEAAAALCAEGTISPAEADRLGAQGGAAR